MFLLTLVVVTFGSDPVGPFPPDAVGVMNRGGVPYHISNTPNSTDNGKWNPGVYSTDFQHNVAGKVEHFDVYGEVHTKYSQVYWTRNTPINLPAALVERFKGKVMAITGYEVDQVTHSGPQTGTTSKGNVLGGFACYPDCSETDRSVPIYHAYNHHYFGWLLGNDAEVYDRDEWVDAPNPTKTGIRDLPSAKEHGFPTNIAFVENPGGEFRKSYHGYPSGYAQLVHSPTNWVVEPMQIDTHNREVAADAAAQPGYHPWFWPSIQDNRTVTEFDDKLSPIIECPCSNRITRRLVQTPKILTQGTCPTPVTSLAGCTSAVASTGAKVSSSASVNNASRPAGCLLVPEANGETYKAEFNTASSRATCGHGKGPFTWSGPFNNTAVSGADYPRSDPKYGCTGELGDQCTWDSVAVAQEQCGRMPGCESIYCSSHWTSSGKPTGGKFKCFARGSSPPTTGFAKSDQVWIKKYTNLATLAGSASLGGLVNLTIRHDGTTASITLQGPAAVWFGVGFGATKMADLPYAIIVDGNGAVTERKLADHGPGTLYAPSVKVVSSQVAAGIRTVVVERPVAGAKNDVPGGKGHYSFPAVPGQINLITAVGDTPTLAYHKSRTGATLTLLPTSNDACVCKPSRVAYLTYMNQTTSEFHYNCLDEPRSDMLRRGDGTGRALPNAACQMETYHGGLRCCKHTWFLTDVEQAGRIPNETDVYFLKWRYYFQEYTPKTPAAAASHKHIHHWVFLIDASVNDYEEDNAHYGTASIGKIEAHLTAG